MEAERRLLLYVTDTLPLHYDDTSGSHHIRGVGSSEAISADSSSTCAAFDRQ